MAQAANDVRGTGDLHGVCMARAWHVHGMCMARAWRVHGTCMACAWHVPRHVHGVCMAPAHGVRGELPVQHDVRRHRTQEALVEQG